MDARASANFPRHANDLPSGKPVAIHARLLAQFVRASTNEFYS